MRQTQITMSDIREDQMQREIARLCAETPGLGELQARRSIQMRHRRLAQFARGGSRVRDCRA